MKSLWILFIAAIVLLACGEDPVEMTSFTYVYMTEEFVKELKNEEIAFERKGQQIFYSVSDRDKVREISARVLAENTPKSVIYDESFYEQVIRVFNAEGIQYRVIQTDEAPGLMWPDEQDEKARRLITKARNSRL